MTADERKQRRNQIREEIIQSKDAVEILGVSRARLNQYVKDGRITPIIAGIYLKDDILALKEAFEKAEEKGSWPVDFE